MWIGNTIYFNSDRDGHFNLYAYDVSGGKTTPVTRTSRGMCAGRAPARDGRIVYELNGELHVLDTKSQKGRGDLHHRSR